MNFSPKMVTFNKYVFYFTFLIGSFISVLKVDGLELDELILKDIIPSVGEKCHSNFENNIHKTTTQTTFTHQPSPSYWHETAGPYEPELFLAEMSHENEDDERQSWTIRIGQGSNIYSFRGHYGEAIPPQFHRNGIFVDEVIQSVSVNQPKNRHSGRPYFIHQAGIYSGDGDYTVEKPFFSPNIVKHCAKNECAFGSWGQQAHVTTFHKSDMLYFNSYRDCGSGVLEFTTVMHNAATDVDGDEVSYLNVPWGGVRTSNLRDLLVSNPSGKLVHQYPIPLFYNSHIPNMKDTGGFTTFTEQIKASEEAFLEHTSKFELPSVNGQALELIVGPGKTIYDKTKSEQWNRPCYRTNIQQTVTVPGGCQLCSLYFTNDDGYRFYIPEIIHWAWVGKYMFYCSPLRDPDDRSKRDDANAWKLNKHLTPGTRITVTMANEGKSEEKNSALTYVHGLGTDISNRWASSRLRYGWAGNTRRDYTVYTGNTRIIINPGDTYVYQQYIVTGALSDMENVASSWVDEVYQDVYTLGEMSGTNIYLFSNDQNSFGANMEDEISCSQGNLVCEGKSVPQNGMSPLFAITCGNSTYVGSDRYHFSPPRASEKETIRSYVCYGEDNDVRPEWKLLGFFVEGRCDLLKNAKYDPHFCALPLTRQNNDVTSYNAVPTAAPYSNSSSSTQINLKSARDSENEFLDGLTHIIVNIVNAVADLFE